MTGVSRAAPDEPASSSAWDVDNAPMQAFFHQWAEHFAVEHHSSKIFHRSSKQNSVLWSYLSWISLLWGPKPPIVEGHKSGMPKVDVIALKSRRPTQFCGHHVFVGCMFQIWLALVSLGHWDGVDRAGCPYSPSRAWGTHSNTSPHWLVQIPPDPRDKKLAMPIQCSSTSNFQLCWLLYLETSWAWSYDKFLI